MLKAGSLLYAIFISILIALISSALILLSFYNHVEVDRHFLQQRIQKNSYSGINLLLSDNEILLSNSAKTIDLYEDKQDSVLLEKKMWGAFEIISSNAQSHGLSYRRIAICGSGITEKEPVSLYLCDHGIPLSISGNTLIKGNCYLPKSGIKHAYIEGQNFIGTKLIDGSISNSQDTLPITKNKLLNEIFGNREQNDSIITIKDINYSDSIVNSFRNKTICFTSNQTINVSCHYLSGNIKIISKKEIKILTNVRLEDVLLFAPKIILEEGVQGNIQAFASDSIFINKNCKLMYPSVLGILNSTDKQRSLIYIDDSCEIQGSIFAFQKEILPQNRVKIEINKNSILMGQVFTNGLVDLKGKIYGSLFCNEIVLKTSVSYYENHLLNAEINASKLSKYYIGVDFSLNPKNNEIIKWVF